MTPTLHTSAQGKFKISVVCAITGEVLRTHKEQNNLILDQGLDRLASGSWLGSLYYCAAGTGTTPTKVAVTGTASQSGTTVTLSGSAYSFVSGDVGSWLKWSTGEEAKITAFTNSTTVTVAQSQFVASGGLVGLFRCGQTALTTEVKRTGGGSQSTAIWPTYTDTDGNWSQGLFFDTVTGKVMIRRTLDFTAESGTVVYTEVGMSWTTGPGNLFSRVLLDTPVTVNNTEKLRVQYNLYVQLPYSYSAIRPTNTTIAITGWPYTYNISGITSNGSNFTVTLSAAHHYLAGGKINIAGASISAYNAEWTVASVTSTTVTVTSALNPGTASAQGTVYNNTKANLYLCAPGLGGLYTNNTNIFGVTYPSTSGAPPWWGNNLSYIGVWEGAWGTGTPDATLSNLGAYLSARVTPPALASSFYTTPTSNGFYTAGTAASYTNGNFYRDYTFTFVSGTANLSTFRSLFFGGGAMSSNTTYAGFLIDFEEPQRKDSGASLNLTLRRSWGRVLA